MTVTYSLDVASSSFLGVHRLLFRWKGSIWKSVWQELLVWLVAYFILSVTYRNLKDDYREDFGKLVKYFDEHLDYKTLIFLLAFYVSAVFSRWKTIFENIGWIDSPGLLISTCIRGHDETARNIRRNIVRYLVLVQAMVFRDISTAVKKRFPTMDHLVTAGLMTTNELKEFDSIVSPQTKYWVPMNWVYLLLREAKDMKLVDSDNVYSNVLEKLRLYKMNLLKLTLYDWIPVPLVYTQVVNLSVRIYFLLALIGRQYFIEDDDDDEDSSESVDLIVPLMTIFQFIIFIGWVKVAEVLLNPLGDDDDDFECNWIIDRNLQVGLAMADDACGKLPKLEKDIFWNEVLPEPLYTKVSADRPHNPMVGSCHEMSDEEAFFLQPPRNRYMSSEAVSPAASRKEKEPGEVLVQKHNPMRRSLSVYSSSGRHVVLPNTRSNIINSLKKRMSRKQRGSLYDGDLSANSHAVQDSEAGCSSETVKKTTSKVDSIFKPNHSLSKGNDIDSDNSDGNQGSSTALDHVTLNKVLSAIEEEENERSRRSTLIVDEEELSKIKDVQDKVNREGQSSFPLTEKSDSLERLKRILRTAELDSLSDAAVSPGNEGGNLPSSSSNNRLIGNKDSDESSKSSESDSKSKNR